MRSSTFWKAGWTGADTPTGHVRARCRGNVESSRGRGAIELGREVGFRDEGGSDVEMSKSLPSFGSHDGGVILRAAINHYKAITPIYSDGYRRDKGSRRDSIESSLILLSRPVGWLIKPSGLGLTGGILPTKSQSPNLIRLGPCLVG